MQNELKKLEKYVFWQGNARKKENLNECASCSGCSGCSAGCSGCSTGCGGCSESG